MKNRRLMVPLALACNFAWAQTLDPGASDSSVPPDSLNQTNTFLEMKLEDLMEVKVVSASKKEESIFEAPLSIGALTREEIKRSGATSLIDALRLVPGLIVRETTNGNYDVHIRGFNDLPTGTVLNQAVNSTILVMIDNRPVYNYFSGGTFWETLPIELNDVEKIEVVRGPSMALYGPNAANGVINFITRRPQKEGAYAVANVQTGSPTTIIRNAAVGYKKGKFDFILSENFQTRQRTETEYYSYVAEKKVAANEITVEYPPGVLKDINGVPNASERYPNPSLALEKHGYNGFVNYQANPKTLIGLNLGGQQSRAQVASVENLGTPLSFRTSTTHYADLHANIHGFSSRVSYQTGIQDASAGFNGYKYNFNTLDAIAEYDISMLKNFSFKPGINYRSSMYDDSKYADIKSSRGFINGARTLENMAGSLRAEYDDQRFLKLIAAARYDKYNHPSQGYLSYQFAANVKLNERNLIRAVYSRAYKGPTMFDTYNSQTLYVMQQPVFGSYTMPLYSANRGNKDLKLQKIDMFELGYRMKATNFLHLDLEAFYQISSDYSIIVNTPIKLEYHPILPIPTKATTIQKVQNIDMRAEQTGFTLGLNFLYGKVQFKPFVTVQQTFLYNVPTSRDSAEMSKTYTDKSNRTTPGYYGGAILNFQATSKLNINLNSYYYGKYTYVSFYNNLYKDKTKGIIDIADRLILNVRVSYKIFERFDVFVSGRNALDNQAQEFSNTDISKGMYLVGGHFEF